MASELKKEREGEGVAREVALPLVAIVGRPNVGKSSKNSPARRPVRRLTCLVSRSSRRSPDRRRISG